MASRLPTTTDRPTTSFLDPWERTFGFPLFNRLGQELDAMFDRFGVDRHFFGPTTTSSSWMPTLEMSTRENQLFVKVDVPGMKKDDLTLEVADDHLVLRGERKHESEEKKDGYFRTERSYGSFVRTVPLPEGAKPDLAKATMHDGVLEIAMPMTKVAETSRKLEIGETAPAPTKSKAA